MGGCIVGKRKEILILDFKLETDPSGRQRIYLLESGMGLTSMLPDPLMRAMHEELALLYPGKKLHYSEENCRDDHRAMQANRANDPLLKNLISGKLQDPSVVIWFDKGKSRYADVLVRQNKWDHIDVFQPESLLYSTDKAFFAAMCAQNGLPIPTTWLCSPATMTQERREAIKKACPNGVIVKPTSNACGEGVAFVGIDQLDAVVAWLNNESTYNPLADYGRFTDSWKQEARGTVFYLIQECIMTAKSGYEPTYRVIFSSDEGKIKILGITEKYSFDVVHPSGKRDSKSLISCTTAAAGKYNLTEIKCDILQASSKEYKNIEALLLPVIQKLVDITPTLDPIQICLDEFNKDRKGNADYIYGVLPHINQYHYKPFTDEQVNVLKECLAENWNKSFRKLSSLSLLFLSGYFMKSNFVAIPAHARTESFFQFIVLMSTQLGNSTFLNEVKKQAETCLIQDEDIKNPNEKMSNETLERIRGIRDLLNQMLDNKAVTTTPCLFGPFAHVCVPTPSVAKLNLK
jgi:hypothetical protein